MALIKKNYNNDGNDDHDGNDDCQTRSDTITYVYYFTEPGKFQLLEEEVNVGDR